MTSFGPSGVRAAATPPRSASGSTKQENRLRRRRHIRRSAVNVEPSATIRRVQRAAMVVAFTAVALLLLGSPAAAQGPDIASQYDRTSASGAMNMVVLDNIFIFVCAVLVLLMQVGFALVEAGLTRAKNAANIMMKNMMDVCIGMLVFGLVGWGIAYPGDFNGVLGSAGLGVAGLTDILIDVSPEALADDGFYPLAVPVDFLFQVAFAATAATIVSGAVAERTKFVGYILYSIGITALIYPIVVSWKWGGGWLDGLGFIDFAGSGLVHMTGGFAALVAAAVLGPRTGKYDPDGRPKALPGHSVPLAMTGVLILFIGWFGFNPGSQLQADMAVPLIAVYTAFAGAAGGLGGMLTSWVTGKKPDVSMAGNGILAGLVAICSGIGEFSWLGTVITGFAGGCLVVVSVLFVERRRIDDPVGAFSVHGVCGFWGLVATGLFATTSPVNGAAESAGLLYGGGFGLLFDQIIGGLAIAVFVTVVSGTLFTALKSANLFRVDADHEAIGLDLCEHGSPGYGPELLTAA
ncbi:MAG: ammonium transporter [Acidimicrobiia bacterium]|nr:ammonium transporter [Acidimicrobiia bacterium]